MELALLCTNYITYVRYAVISAGIKRSKYCVLPVFYCQTSYQVDQEDSEIAQRQDWRSKNPQCYVICSKPVLVLERPFLPPMLYRCSLAFIFNNLKKNLENISSFC